jgi:hypothetical protein
MKHTENHDRYFFPVFLTLVCITLCSSCKYGLDEFISRENDVNKRSTNITDIALDLDPALPDGLVTIILPAQIHSRPNTAS